MQDEVNEKVVSLAIKTSKLTAEVLQKAMKALLAKGKGQLTKAPHGKITMRQLMKPGEKVSNIEITDQNIKAFDPIARKNGLDYNVKKIENGKPPTYLVSFKGKDIDVMTEAFREFTAKKLGRDKKPSIQIYDLLTFALEVVLDCRLNVLAGEVGQIARYSAYHNDVGCLGIAQLRRQIGCVNRDCGYIRSGNRPINQGGVIEDIAAGLHSVFKLIQRRTVEYHQNVGFFHVGASNLTVGQFDRAVGGTAALLCAVGGKPGCCQTALHTGVCHNHTGCQNALTAEASENELIH